MHGWEIHQIKIYMLLTARSKFFIQINGMYLVSSHVVLECSMHLGTGGQGQGYSLSFFQTLVMLGSLGKLSVVMTWKRVIYHSAFQCFEFLSDVQMCT